MRKKTLVATVERLQERNEIRERELDNKKDQLREVRKEVGKIKEVLMNVERSKYPLVLHTIEYGDGISGYQRFQCKAHGWDWNRSRSGHKVFYKWNEQGEQEKVAVFYCDSNRFISHTEVPSA